MKRFDGWRRYAGFALGAAVWSLAAPAAHAQGITNPAKNPFPVTVTIDGQSYSDGRDTLPGYDDELCTPIPNVQYDFAENQILYYSGDGELLKTARWTEWARISSYQTWLDQQNAATPTPTATATPAPTSAPTTSAPTTSAPTGSTDTNSATTGPAATSPAAKTPFQQTLLGQERVDEEPVDQEPDDQAFHHDEPFDQQPRRLEPGLAEHVDGQPVVDACGEESARRRPRPLTPAAPRRTTPRPLPRLPTVRRRTPRARRRPLRRARPTRAGVTPVAGVENATPAPGPATAKKYKLASEQVGVAGGEPDTRLAGIGILAALCAVGFFCLLFGELRHRAFGRR